MESVQPIGYIYLITNLINEKIYIGKTESTIHQRWYTHTWRACHLDRVEKPIAIDLAIAKYGLNNFEVNEIDKAYSKEDLHLAEAYWIDFYDATNPDKGYNIDPMGKIINLDDYESIWEIKFDSEVRKQRKEKWRESLIKKKIPIEKEKEFKEDLRYLSGVQLEKKYGLYPNRRALLREIRRILGDMNIKTMKQAKLAVEGEVWDPKKYISQEIEQDFIEDFKNLSGVQLENKYGMSRNILVRNIKKIFNNKGLNTLNDAMNLSEIKTLLGGLFYDSKMKNVPLERENEFRNDVRTGLTLSELCKKYGLGSTSFYRELKRLCGIENLTEIRVAKRYIPPIKEYVPKDKVYEFKEDLKILSGKKLELKYGIPDRVRLFREIRRILRNESLKSMEHVKEFIGGEVYDRMSLKKGVPPDKEEEFKNDVTKGLTRRKLCEKYNFGTKVLYRELNRLFNTRSLKELRKK